VNHVPNFHVSEHFSQCFKVFNPSKSWKQRCTTQHIYISGKISYFLDTNEKQTKLWTRNGSRLWHQKSHKKHAWTLYFLRFVSLTCLVWWGKIKKFEKKTLLGHFWIAQSMDFIFPILNGYRPNSRGFRTITREPQTQISCFLVLIALFWWV